MTRPFLSSHRSAGKALAYISRSDAGSPAPELLGGTIPWRGFRHTIAHLKRLPLPQQPRNRFLHVTLSPPARPRLSDATLLEAVNVMFRSLGLASRAMPWLAFRHRNTDCHHVHIPAGRIFDERTPWERSLGDPTAGTAIPSISRQRPRSLSHRVLQTCRGL